MNPIGGPESRTFRELPPGRRFLIIALIAGGIAAGILIAVSPPRIKSIAMAAIPALALPISTAMAAIYAYLYTRERKKLLAALMGLFALLLGLLAFDALKQLFRVV